METIKKARPVDRIPPIFGDGEIWTVQDSFGNLFQMDKHPCDMFIKEEPAGVFFYLVYSTGQEKLPENAVKTPDVAPPEDDEDPF